MVSVCAGHPQAFIYLWPLFISFLGTAFNAQVLINDGNGDGNKDRIGDG